jgi:hypothetical protein
LLYGAGRLQKGGNTLAMTRFIFYLGQTIRAQTAVNN